jgi:hypothetical protein
LWPRWPRICQCAARRASIRRSLSGLTAEV